MKAIVNLDKNSPFARYNGLAFEVKRTGSKTCTLIIDGSEVDFAWKEVLLQDFQKELQSAYSDMNWYGGFVRIDAYENLKRYQEIHQIIFETRHVMHS